MDEHIGDPSLVFSGLETCKLPGVGEQSTVHLLESQARAFVLAGGVSIGVVNVSARRVDEHDGYDLLP